MGPVRISVDPRSLLPWDGCRVECDFSGMKLKLIASIAAISAIALLRAFLPLADEGVRVDAARLSWMVAIHLTFVGSGVLLATMDWITSKVHIQAAGG